MELRFPENDRVRIVPGEGGVAQVFLARPDKLNALDMAMFEQLIAAGQALRGAKGLRVVVLSGEGRAFSAGLDLASFASPGDPALADLVARTHGQNNFFQQAAMQWRDLPVPVIAAVQGVCFGGALQIVSGADIRVVAPDARLSIAEVALGIVPDMGGFALWRGLLRQDALRELVYGAREFSGEEAHALGLATLLDPDPLARAMAIATGIAARSPDAVRQAKRLANLAQDAPTPDILVAESRAQQELLFSKNQIEAVASRIQKRPPRFEDS